MATREIRTAHVQTACDVCGRTLLRGEHADTFLQAGLRRAVCELCAPRVLREGWVREGAMPEAAPREQRERRRGLLDRLRARRPDAGPEEEEGVSPPASRPEPTDPADGRAEPPSAAPSPPPVAPEPRPARSVRGVPVGAVQRTAAALDIFNASEHPRTVAGVARSLGPPEVSVVPRAGDDPTVAIVAAWELCWYRWEASLADGGVGVRLDAQGYELDELSAQERVANAEADQHGRLSALG